MLTYAWIFLGGGLGSLARFWVAELVVSRWGAAFPLGTMLVNLSGCFVIGLFAGLTDADGRWIVQPAFRQFFMIGVCGGYTTFSAFSLQTLDLARAGETFWAGLNVLASVAGCLAAVWAGHAIALLLNRR